MLVLLPISVWILGLLFWLGSSQEGSPKEGLNTIYSRPSVRSAVILTSISWGAYLALSAELLSLLHALTRLNVALLWGFALCVLGFLGLRKGVFQRGLQFLQLGFHSLQPEDRLLAGVLILLSSLLLLVALVSFSGTTDSLLYHLSRVMHWIQNASLSHYATASVQQLYNPIWAEEAILNLRLLGGNDRFASLVQWFAMLGSLAALTQIAAELRVGRIGQWVAAAFAFSIPMGVLQSVSTQNDYVVSFWLLCVAWLCLRATSHIFSSAEAVMLGLAVGLGSLTKGTFYPYVVPFGLWFLFAALRCAWLQPDRKIAFKQTLLSFGIFVLCVVLLNGGYWLRNLSTFNGPLGPSEWVSYMTAGQYSPGAFFASLLGQLVMNFSTPSEQINSLIVDFFRNQLAQIDSRMSGFALFWGWNHEDMAGNPLHVIMIFLAILVLFFNRKRLQDRRLWVYLAALGGALAMLVFVVHFDIFGVRYQLPLFILAAPLVGKSLDLVTIDKAKVVDDGSSSIQFRTRTAWVNKLWLLALLLFLGTLPWILINRSRPLLALKEGGEPFSVPCLPVLGCTVGSILFEPPVTSLFANHYSLRNPYSQLSTDLRSTGCQQIGLWLDSHDPEYLFWWLLDAPQSGKRLETLYTFPQLERYIDPGFKPCAIICTICNDRTRLHGLPLIKDYSVARLYAGSGFTPQSSSPVMQPATTKILIIKETEKEAALTDSIEYPRQEDKTSIVPLRDLVEGFDLLIGSAVLPVPLQNDPIYAAVLSREFNLLTPENALKFGPVHPQPDTYSFANADTIIEFAQANAIAVHGHVLVWHQQLPKWVEYGKWEKQSLEKVLTDHIQTVVGRYQGRIQYWDVVNEALDDSGGIRDTLWSRILGPGYMELAFQLAHAADPQAKLFYNDYNTEGINSKSDKVYELVKGMLERNVPIHGVGLQMHIIVDDVPAGLQANIQRLSDLGLEVQITELDVRIPGEVTPEKLARQAETYRQVMQACLAVSKCTAFITWGFTDRYSWVPGFFTGYGSALVFDPQYQPKPAYQALQEVLKDQ